MIERGDTMSYKIVELNEEDSCFATMTLSIPDYSRALHKRAVASMKKELARMGVEVSDEAYDFSIAQSNEDNIEVVEIEIYVRTKELGEDTASIKFKEIPSCGKMIRVIADDFADVHTGLAEWMHENDAMENGQLRQVVTDLAPYVFDSPVRPSDD